MKLYYLKFVIFFILTGVSYDIFGQKKINGLVQYNCTIDIGLGKSIFEAVLFFNADSNYFQTFKDKIKKDTSSVLMEDKTIKASYEYHIQDTIGFKIISDKKANKIFSREILLNKLIPIYENIPEFNWKISDETKVIGKSTCTKATCNFRGRRYIAWFDPNIGVDAGPYKFQRLPGLILEVTDTENKVSFIATKITYPFEKPNPISPNYNPASIERAEYVKEANLRYKNLSKYLQSTMRSDQTKGKISVKTKAIGIEDLNELE